MRTKLLMVLLISSLILGCANKTVFNKTEVEGVKVPEILLNGTWKFTMDPPEEFWSNNIDFQNWADIQVPGECQMQGFAIMHDTPYVYKKEFQIPEDYDGKQIDLNFYGIYSHARIWLNGHFLREHYGGFTKWTCDITDFVEAGDKAVLTVEITDRTDDISYGSGYAKHQIGGILRDVELTALPKQHFKKLYFETDLDEEYINADLKIFYELAKNIPLEVKIELINADEKVVSSVKKQIEDQYGVIEIPVKNPKKWDAEHPNLYTAVISLFQDGKEVLKTVKKIGFREVEVYGNKLLVNGNPIKLRGACRHDIHPEMGRMTTPEYDLKDVLLAKECNMNFIRTSHYPPSEHFLNYCDEFGIYIEDETAVCFVGSHRTEAYRKAGASENDPNYTARYLSQLEEMVQHHRNHPSIIIWSIGNENHFGNNFVESYNWVKKNDLTRPVIYSYPGLVPDSLEIYDIISMHYPDWRGNLNQYRIITKGFESAEKPMLFDEWAHVACYNNFELKEDPNVRSFWGQSLDSMWTYLFETEGGLGGAIWGMIDETFMLPEDLEGFNQWWGILDKNIIPATYEGPCIGYGEWGIIDTWRRKKPEFWATKKAYSPTKIYSKQINDFKKGQALKIPVHNRFDHTNFSELKIEWEYGNQSGELPEFDLEPHQKGTLTFPANNWNTQEKLNIQFYLNDTFLVDEYKLQIGQKSLKLPTCKTGNLSISDVGDIKMVAGKHYTLEVDTKTGLIQNVKAGEDLLLKSGPYLNLRIPGESVQYSTIQMDDWAKNWECTNFSFIEEDGIAKISAHGKYDKKIEFSYSILMDENGVLVMDYMAGNLEEGKSIQEAGIKFIAGDNFKKLAWERNPYFTAYPEASMGSSVGEVSIFEKPAMFYRQKPGHRWEMDSKGFYYFGLERALPYTNIVRGLKENIFSYSLKTDKSILTIFSDGTQAGRFDEIKGENTLIVNDLWDYNSLLWGNYNKQIKSKSIFKGRVNLVCE